MNIIFDTETTGTFSNNAKTEEDFLTFPRVLQLAWKLGDKERNLLIFQEGREVPEGATKVHGITTEMANDPTKTVKVGDALTEFLTDLLQAEKVIGHNVYFDVQMVKSEVFRLFGVESPEGAAVKVGLDQSKRVCTMKRGTGLDPTLKNNWGGPKWPKLIELYTFLFKEGFEGAHDALGDLRATERCHYALTELGR